MAVLLSVCILSVFGLVICAFSKDLFDLLRTRTPVFRLIYAIALLLPGLFLFLLLSNERFIYSWDYAMYWQQANYFTEFFFRSPLGALKALYHSMNHDEYNPLANLFLAPVNKLLGLDFENYVLSIYLVYFVPLSLLVANLCIRVLPATDIRFKLFVPLLCLVFAPLIVAMRFGMLDMVGLIVIFIVLNILVRTDFMTHVDYKAALVIGLLLTILLFTRRWYIFWAVAYFPTLFLMNATQSFVKRDRSRLLASLINLSLSGATVICIVLVFFYPFFEMSFLKDYRDIYAAYRYPIAKQLQTFVPFYGLAVLVLTIVGAYSAFKINSQGKRLMSFLLFSTVLIFLLFTRINGFAIHHSYLLAPFFTVACLMAAFSGGPSAKKPIFYTVVLMLIINYVAVFVVPVFPSTMLFSSMDARPIQRTDFTEINAVSDDLAEVQNQGNYAYVLASSLLLNDVVIRNTKLPDVNYHKALFASQHVDKRDRFPSDLFLANYVVVTDPVQLHLREEDQQVISYLNAQILDGFLEGYYETVNTYIIDNGIRVYVKRRLSALEDVDLQQVKGHFERIYPNYPDMYRVDEPLARVSHALKGDGAGKLGFEDSDLIIHPGNLRPSEISFALDSTKSYTVSFATHFTDKEGAQQSLGPSFTGEVSLDVYLEEELHSQAYHTHEKDSVYHIPLNGISSVKLRVGKGKDGTSNDWFQLNDFQIVEN